MPAKQLIVAKRADKSFLRLPLNIQKKIIHAYKKLKENPLSGHKLLGDLSGYYKYRVGDYRIIYIFDNKKSTICVLKIEHRQGVYR